MAAILIQGRLFRDPNSLAAVSVSTYGAVVTMPYTIEETHDGRFFMASYYNGSVANGATLDMILNTGSITVPHFGVMVSAGGQGVLTINEAATTSSDGTPVTIFNANRGSAKVSTATAFQTPTVTGTGTTLIISFSSGGSGGNALGSTSGEFARVTEILMKPSTKYLVRFTNTAGTAQPASMQFGFFEDV